MPTIMLFTTGGTIATRDRDRGAVRSPQLSGRQLLKLMPSSVLESYNVEVVELGLLPSTAITPSLALDWAMEVRKQLSREDVEGAVVTIGTNAMEETSYLFDLTIDARKPVVFTGAMRMPAQLSSDAARNLVSSLLVVCDKGVAKLGVVVVMNDEIHAARDVIKTHSHGVHAFSSPSNGLLGRVVEASNHGHCVQIERHLPANQRIPVNVLEPRVGYVKAVLGSDGILIDALMNSGARGIVIEAFGEGSTTSGMAVSIEQALRSGIPIVIASRALSGGTVPLYTEMGESRWLLNQGAIFAGNLSGPKARIKLMVALGSGDRSAISKWFKEDTHASGISVR
jgi:L-asparaginase